MKYQIIYRSIFFVLLVIFCDWLVGATVAHFYRKSRDITISKIRYTFFDTSEDVLILGSSRAQHHYNPETLVQGTQFTCFNGGLGGQPLAFSLVQLSKTFERYKPKLILLDVTPDFRWDRDSDPRLKVLGPFYRTDTLVKRILLDNGPRFERLKYLSSTFPYNGMLADLVLAYLYVPNVSASGYIPSPDGLIESDWQMHENEPDYQGIPDKQRFYLKTIVELCKNEGVDLWIVISPLYNTTEGEKEISGQLADFASEHKVKLMNFSQVLTDHRFFKDHLHLSTAGADVFTSMVRDSISAGKESLINNNLEDMSFVN